MTFPLRRSPLFLAAALLLVSALALLVGSPSSRAEEPTRPRSMVYLSVSGDGSTAKAWYRGAPPNGLLVQEALDLFAREGYHVQSVTSGHRPAILSVTSGSPTVSPQLLAESQYLIVLEK